MLILAMLVPLSCRTYGGHGSEEATLEQIEAAHAAFERDLAQAKNDLRLVSAEGGSDGPAAGIAGRLEAVVLVHDAMVAHHAELAEQARQHAGSYRFLNRTLGGMLSDQEVVYGQYADLLRFIESAASVDSVESRSSVIPRYHVVPPYFERLQHASYIRPVGNISRTVSASGATAASGARAATTDTLQSPAAPATAETAADAAGDTAADATAAD